MIFFLGVSPGYSILYLSVNIIFFHFHMRTRGLLLAFSHPSSLVSFDFLTSWSDSQVNCKIFTFVIFSNVLFHIVPYYKLHRYWLSILHNEKNIAEIWKKKFITKQKVERWYYGNKLKENQIFLFNKKKNCIYLLWIVS